MIIDKVGFFTGLGCTNFYINSICIMQSNMHNFPADEFMECLRNNRSGSAKYIEEVNNLNTYLC